MQFIFSFAIIIGIFFLISGIVISVSDPEYFFMPIIGMIILFAGIIGLGVFDETRHCPECNAIIEFVDECCCENNQCGNKKVEENQNNCEHNIDVHIDCNHCKNDSNINDNKAENTASVDKNKTNKVIDVKNFCGNCGAKIIKENKYCSNCGNKY